MDHCRPLRLEPERDARAGEHGAVVADEGDVRGPQDPHDPRRPARLAHAVDDRGQHVVVRQPRDRLSQAVCERGADGDHDLGGIVPGHGRAGLFHDRGRVRDGGTQAPRVDDVRQRLQQRPALALEPVARSRPEVEIRVVDGRPDEPVGLDHRGGLEVVRRDPLAQHPDDRLGDVHEALPVERERHVERRDPPGEQRRPRPRRRRRGRGRACRRCRGRASRPRPRRRSRRAGRAPRRPPAPPARHARARGAPRAPRPARCRRRPASRAASSATRRCRPRRSSHRRTCCRAGP